MDSSTYSHPGRTSLHRPAQSRERRLGTDGRDLRRIGPPCAQRGRRAGAAARRRGRDRRGGGGFAGVMRR